MGIGYKDVVAVDVLDGATLSRVGVQTPAHVTASVTGLDRVAWSSDGQTLFGVGGDDAQGRTLIYAWGERGLGPERRTPICDSSSTAYGFDALPAGQMLVGSMAPCIGLIDAGGEPLWNNASPILDVRYQTDVMRVSQDGRVVDFGHGYPGTAALRFHVGLLVLSPAPNDGLTSAKDCRSIAGTVRPNPQ